MILNAFITSQILHVWYHIWWEITVICTAGEKKSIYASDFEAYEFRFKSISSKNLCNENEEEEVCLLT